MRKLRALAVAALLFGAAPAGADAPAVNYAAAEASISYQIVHKLHKFRGTSRKIEARGRILPDGKAQVMVRVPVESFDSGNANRDAHMKEAVEAARFAAVELKAAAEGVQVPDRFPATIEKKFSGELIFHGVKQPIEVPAQLTFESADRLKVGARFSISLDSFKVERPSLMFVKVDDAAAIEVTMVMKK